MAATLTPTTLVFFLLGGMAGAVAMAWVARRALSRRLYEQRQQFDARLTEAADSSERLHQHLEALLPRVAESVLASKTQQLERLAASELKQLSTETVAQVGKSQAGLQATLEAMQQRLAEYQGRITEFEKERALSQGRLHQQMDAVTHAGALMAREAQTLREALATSGGVRGKWGEAVLQNILESCGLNDRVDYHLQGREQGGQPDAVIHLPTGRHLIVDAKANLSEFLAGLEFEDMAARQACHERFAVVLRREAQSLARRDYPAKFDGSLPFVVMFVASEGAFRAALDADPGLFQFGQELQPAVLLASPSTLFPLISIIANGWQQHRASQQVGQLVKEVGVFGTRLKVFVDHVLKIGKGIHDAGEAYDQAARSFNARLAPQMEQLNQLGANWDEIKPLQPVETRPLLAAAARRD